MLWRRKYLNITLLLATTAGWAAMEIYQYNFIPLLCYITMAILTFFFVWGYTYRLLKKESPDLSELEISEQRAVEVAYLIRQKVNELVWMVFHVSAEREWFVTVGIVVSLYLLSLVTSCLDFPTLCYIGVLGFLSLPLIYVKNEHKIGELGEKLRMRSQNLYGTTRQQSQKIYGTVKDRSSNLYGTIKERSMKMKNEMTTGKQKEVKEKKIE